MKDSSRRFDFRSFWSSYQVWIIFIGLMIIYGIISPEFFTARNINNIMTQNAMLVVVALAQLLVVITGGIDLSVGAILALTGVMTAQFVVGGMPVGLAVLAAMGIGAIAGAISGLLVAKFKFAPFIATLATMVMVQGMTFVKSGGHVTYVSDAGFRFLGRGYILNIPVLVWVMLLIIVVVWFVLKKTVVGRRLYAVGGNPEAARLAGIKVPRYQFTVYVCSGILCGLAGAFMACRLGAGSPTIGSGWELDAIAAVVVGGASLMGGTGTALNSVLGALIIGFIRNILNLLGVATYPQLIVKGLIIILAVLSQNLGSGIGSRKKIGGGESGEATVRRGKEQGS